MKLTVTLPASESQSLEPASHVFITVPSLNSIAGNLRANPFTISSLSFEHGYIKLNLVVAVRDGLTKQLLDLSKRNSHTFNMSGAEPKLPVSVFVPSQRRIPSMDSFERILIVAGGVGGTFCLPLAQRLAGRSSRVRKSLRVIWSVRHASDVSWAFPETSESLDRLEFPLELYFTGKTSTEQTGLLNGSDEDIDLRSSNHPGIELYSRFHDRLTGTHKRPDVATIIADEVAACVNGDKLAIVVCGPASMASAVKRHVGYWINRESLIWFWEEGFGY